MAKKDLGRVVGKDATAAMVQEHLSKFEFTEDDAHVCIRENVDIAEGGLSYADGLAAGDVVLLVGQTDAEENGLYTVQEDTWLRLAGYDTGDGQAFDFRYIRVISGVDAGKVFTISSEQYVIGETPLQFIETAFSEEALPGKIVIYKKDGSISGIYTKEEIDRLFETAFENIDLSGVNELLDELRNNINTKVAKAGDTMTGVLTAGGTQAVGTAQVRNSYAGTGDMVAGSTSLTTGRVYFVYE